jgi:3-oxoadipate enol-lactonase
MKPAPFRYHDPSTVTEAVGLLAALENAKVNAEGLGSVLDVAIRRMFPEPFIAAHPDVIEARKAALAKADPAAFHHACLALAELDLRPLLPGIRNRTLVMVGELDQTTPPAIARELAAGIPGASYQEIPACGHCPQLQSPEDLIARIVAFASA